MNSEIFRQRTLGKSVLLVFFVSAILTAGLSVYSALEILNPIGAKSFGELILRLTGAIVKIAMVFAPVAILIVGFKLIAAAASGDAKKLQDTKTMLWWVIIGTAVVVGASVLAGAVVQFVKEL